MKMLIFITALLFAELANAQSFRESIEAVSPSVMEVVSFYESQNKVHMADDELRAFLKSKKFVQLYIERTKDDQRFSPCRLYPECVKT